MLRFKKLIEARSGGRIAVDVFHSSQLGNERDLIGGLQFGTVQMTVISTAPLSGFTSDFLVFDLPFIFSDAKAARECVDGEIGQSMLDRLSYLNIKGLCFFENGFRSVTNSARPIRTPADLEGLRIRTMENPIHMETFRAMKAEPAPMPFGDLFTALRQKSVTAQENPLAIVETSKLYEVQSYLSLTEHFYSPAPVLVSMEFFNSLPADLQTAVEECLLESRAYQRELLDRMNADLLETLSEQGMTINVVDKDSFFDAVQPVYDMFAGAEPGKIPLELIRKVRAFNR
jgi:tripartite ATP-independent transporter DctP family solute receptor